MSGNGSIPYIGSKISLVTNSELRYEGILININTANSTVTLREVRMLGTENRKAANYVVASNEIFDYIVFNGKDIKDLTVSEPAFSVQEDPAIVAVNVAPPPPHVYQGQGGQQDMGYNKMGGYHQHQAAVQQAQNHPHPDYGYQPQMGRGVMSGMMGNRGAREFYNNNGMYNKFGGYRSGNTFNNGGNRMGSRTGRGNVVGELSAQPNNSLKTQVAQEFNFEQSNSKFQKEELTTDESAQKPAGYDKNKSFFDNISCETLDRQSGRDSRMDRDKQRELDTETFGAAAAVNRGPRYYRRGFRRGAPGPMMRRGGDFGTAPRMYMNPRQQFGMFAHPGCAPVRGY